MEHLSTLIISALLAGLIVFFPTTDEVARKNKQFTQNSKTIIQPTVSSALIISWFNETSPDTTEHMTLSSAESFGDLKSLNIKVANEQLILDMPEAVFDTSEQEDRIVLKTPNYWEIVYSIESKQGKRLYRPLNKEKSCDNTTAPCGHYQISAQALKDIGCNTDQCKMDRESYKQSLTMSQALEKINLGRLANKGYSHLPDYQKYLIHQQGATGIRNILDAQDGRHTFSKRLMKNIANNSPYSYKTLNHYGSQLAAVKFLNYWKNKWEAEIEMIFAEQYKEQIALRKYLQVASNIRF